MSPSAPSGTAPPRLFDRARLARNRDRAAGQFDDYAFLKARVSSDIAERLEDTAHTFEAGLDLGTHDGRLAALLVASGKVTHVEAADIAPAMVSLACAKGINARVLDEESPAFTAGQYDLIVSALTLHWVNDLPGALVQIRQALKPDGLFLGALFGAGTLPELRACLLQAESDIMGGAAPRLSPLPGLQDMAGLMQRAGFALPVVDRDSVTVRYDSPLNLMSDLKGMGERAAFARATTQPLPRRVLRQALEMYHENFSDPDGRIRASFEIVHLSGWAPSGNQPKPLKPGSAKASLADAVRNHGKS